MKDYRLPFDPGLLTSFLATAEAGGVSAAAKRLHVSQPAVTAHLQKLEEQLKAQLFVRSAAGVTLTAQGRKLVTHARKVLAGLDDLARDVSGARDAEGHLGMASSTTIAAHVLPPYLEAFRRRFPKVSIGLRIANTIDVLASVREGRVALGLVEGHARAHAVRLEPFVADEIVLVASPGASPPIRRLGDLAAHVGLVREEGSGTRAVVERALRKAVGGSSPFKEKWEIGGSETIKACVSAGLGVAFLSRASIRNELALGKLQVVPLPGFSIVRMFHWALPTQGLSGPAAAFHAFTRNVIT